MNIGQVLESNGWERSSVPELRVFYKNGWDAYYDEDHLFLDHHYYGYHTIKLEGIDIQAVEKRFNISSDSKSDSLDKAMASYDLSKAGRLGSNKNSFKSWELSQELRNER